MPARRPIIGAVLVGLGLLSVIGLTAQETFVRAPIVVRQLCERWDEIAARVDFKDTDDTLIVREMNEICRHRRPLPD